MNFSQFKNSLLLFIGNILIKFSNFFRQLLLAFYIGVSQEVDVLIISQLVPLILGGVIGGLAGEIIITVSNTKKGVNPRFVIMYLFIMQIIALLAILLFFVSISIWVDVLDIKPHSWVVFKNLSFIFCLNIFPGILVSVMQPLVYLKEKYKYFIFTTLLSELSGILLILFSVKKIGILAFALGITCASIINAASFIYILEVKITYLFDFKAWIREKKELISLLKKHFLLTGNSLIGHLSTFIERTLSVKYLNPGYLGSLNYSKTLFLLPNSILLSSIITTTYMEQVKNKDNGIDELSNYSKKMFGIISVIAMYFQVLLTLFAPLILILFFRRGKFGNSDVESTLIIFEILIFGFIPVVINDFLIRTLYVFSRFRILLIIGLINILSQVLLIFSLVGLVHEIVPISIIVGYYTATIILFKYTNRELSTKISRLKFFKRLLFVLPVCGGAVIINYFLLPFYLKKSNLELLLITMPLVIIFIFFFAFILKKNGFMAVLTDRIPILQKVLPRYFYQNA